jgi:DNA-binding transcriptional LysR family regulator
MRLTEDGLALHERTRGLMAELQEAGEAVASHAPVARAVAHQCAHRFRARRVVPNCRAVCFGLPAGLMVREAVLTGVGAAMLPRLLVEQDVAAGRLVCWGTEQGPPVEIWALYNSRRLLSVKVRAFLDALQNLPARVRNTQ